MTEEHIKSTHDKLTKTIEDAGKKLSGFIGNVEKFRDMIEPFASKKIVIENGSATASRIGKFSVRIDLASEEGAKIFYDSLPEFNPKNL